MDFKKAIESDLDHVFFNVKEFAVPVIIEGEEVFIVPDEDRLKERQLKKGFEGVHDEELLFYVPRKNISFYPRPDNVMNYDDCKWIVTECSEDLGMFTVKAKRTRG